MDHCLQSFQFIVESQGLTKVSYLNGSSQQLVQLVYSQSLGGQRSMG